MRSMMRLLPGFVAVIGFAQTPDVNQRLLEEMKGVRGALDRLVQLTETIAKNQVALLALQQMMGYENQVRILQSQRSQFATQESDLSKQVAAMEDAARAAGSGMNPAGLIVPGVTEDPQHRAVMLERLANMRRSLEEVRGKLQAVDRESSMLRSRIEQLQKTVEGARR